MNRCLLLALALAVACRGDDGLTVHNASPEASITSHGDGDEVAEAQLVELRGTASDPDKDDELLATWLSGEDVLCAEAAPAEDGTTTCTVGLGLSQGDITLEVRDQDDASASDHVSLTVVPNATPEVEIDLPLATGEYYADQLVPFEGNATDVEDGPAQLDIWWESDEDGELTEVEASPNADGDVAGSGYLSVGDHEITLFAEDSTGRVGSDQVLVTVAPANSAPTCEITAPEDGSVGEHGQLVTFEATVGDVDISADQLDVEWSSDEDGFLATSVPTSGGAVSYATTDLSQNTHLVTLTVEDDLGATCTDDVVYTVGNPPTITIDAPMDGDLVNDGDVVVFTGTASDTDHAPTELDISWTSDLDGEFNTDDTDGSGHISFSTDELGVGTHTITATATDPDDFWGRDQITLVVNGPPTAPVIDLTPDPAYTEDDLEVVITTPSTDPESATVSYEYDWFRNGTPYKAATTATLPKSATSKTQVWRVEVTPWDGYAYGPSDDAQVTIDNSPPTAPVVSIQAFAEGDTDADYPVEGVHDLICQVETDSEDADGDGVDYTVSWTLGGKPWTGSTATVYEDGDTIEAASTTELQEWACEIEPWDGTDEGLAGEAEVTIRGTPIDYAHINWPCSMTLLRSSGTGDIYTWLYQPGVTDADGEGAGLTVEVGVGDDGTMPDTDVSWVWYPAEYNDDKPGYTDQPRPWSNDEYLGTITAPTTVGSFDYAARVSTDGGLSWVYVDLGGDSSACDELGTGNDYDPDTAGELTVIPS